MNILKRAAKGAIRAVNGVPLVKWVIRRAIGFLPDGEMKYKIRNKLEHNWDDEVLKIERDGYVMYSPSKSIIGMMAASFGFRPNFQALLAKYVKNPKTLVEVGANIGRDTIYMAKAAPSVHVIAFEPTKKFKDLLEKNVAANGAKNVTVVGEFLSATVGEEIAINVATHSASIVHSASLHFPTIATEKAITTTLDQYFADHAIDSLDLLKIDTDGADEQVIKGAANTIRKYKPFLFVEFSGYHLEMVGASIQSLAKTISDLGYNDFLLLEKTGDPIPVTGWEALVSRISPQSTVDVFAIPT